MDRVPWYTGLKLEALGVCCVATAVDNRFKFFENDTADALDVEFQGVDITGYTITLNIGYPDCAKAIPAILTDPLNGKFRFVFAHGDLRRGSFPAEIRIVDTLGREDTWGEITFDILRRVKG